jgi:hypothetical protein
MPVALFPQPSVYANIFFSALPVPVAELPAAIVRILT